MRKHAACACFSEPQAAGTLLQPNHGAVKKNCDSHTWVKGTLQTKFFTLKGHWGVLNSHLSLKVRGTLWTKSFKLKVRSLKVREI